MAATEEAGFLKSIFSESDDDAPRLVYADWLEENGEPERAEFIRLQCKHARLFDDAVNLANAEGRRASQLEREHGPRWLAGLPQLPDVQWGLWRGVPARVSVPGWREFRKYARRMFQAAPVEYVTFGRLTWASARALARSAYLPRIRVLDLAWGAVRAVGALRALLHSPALANLRTLRLFHSGLGDEAAAAVANCPHLTGLKLLSMYSSGIGDAGAFAMAASPCLPKSCFIEFSRNEFGNAAERALRKRFRGRINV